MAELQENSAIVPSGVNYSINISDFDAANNKRTLSVPIPQDQYWGNIMLKVAVLKKNNWKDYDIDFILMACLYADRMGLDIIAGDVYPAQGRLATTAGAKIRHAMGTGRIAGYHVEITEGTEISIKYKTKSGEAVWKGKDLRAKVTVDVAGWKNPVIYETSLAEWFVGSNPNWQLRTAYMLRRNALSKALEEVAPLGIEGDEAPPTEERAAAV
jgi:hypothetical protein